MKYHIYWNDRILVKDLDKEEFENLWTKLHWVYNEELNYVEVGEEILEESSYKYDSCLEYNLDDCHIVDFCGYCDILHNEIRSFLAK